MRTIEYGGLTIKTDDDGFLENFDEWDEMVACAPAEKEGVDELTDDRLDILKFI